MKTFSLCFAVWVLCAPQLFRSSASAQMVAPPAARGAAAGDAGRPDQQPDAAASAPATAITQPALEEPAAGDLATPSAGVREPAGAPPEGRCDGRKLDQLQADVTALRVAMVELLARRRSDAEHEARARKQAHWVRKMEIKRDAIRLRPSAGLAVGAALAASAFGVMMVKNDYAAGAIIMTSLTAALAVGAAVKLGKLVHARRAIDRELRTRVGTR